jgi:hypothetical protein
LLCGWLLFCFCPFFISYVTDHWFHSMCIYVSDVPVSSLKGWTVLSHFILMISFWRSSLQRNGASFSTVHKEISLFLQCSFYISVALFMLCLCKAPVNQYVNWSHVIICCRLSSFLFHYGNNQHIMFLAVLLYSFVVISSSFP